jgi:hypothetical protein
MQAPPPVTGIASLPNGTLASAGAVLALGALQVAVFVLLQESQALIAGSLIGLWVLVVMALMSLIRSPAIGQLVWDGAGWQWSSRGSGGRCDVTVHLDFNRVVLVALHTDHSSKTWLWLEANNQPLTWLELRRALFADSRGS